jgi:hypothetical protein
MKIGISSRALVQSPFLFAWSFFLFSGPLGAASVTPVYDLRFLGGQHFYNGRSSALSGNVEVLMSPAVKFNDKWSLIPTYWGSYRGTRDVQELAGGGTLFQDSTAHGGLVKGIYQAGPALKLKAVTGARYEFLRETKDESWGDGLFDYQKYTGGVEAEYGRTPRAGVRAGYDYYLLRFPNYESLESSQDPTLSRELAGQKVLDSQNHLVSLGFWSPMPGNVRWDVSAYGNARSFDDQAIVSASGELTPRDRSDQFISADTSLARPLIMTQNLRMVGELGFAYSRLTSNQNHYDARKTVFLEDYYNYSQTGIRSRLSAALGEKPWLVSLGATLNRRNYGDRPIQDANGDYLTEKTRITDITTSLGVTYPLTQTFKARIVGTLGWSDSNMKYEKVFAYNYKIANYMFGFSYEY